jgi:hypothetical protein
MRASVNLSRGTRAKCFVHQDVSAYPFCEVGGGVMPSSSVGDLPGSAEQPTAWRGGLFSWLM